MLYMIFFLVCLLSSAIGAICGIGGGVIIKPVLDALGVLDVEVLSFLSGCTVLSMTTYSVIRSRLSGASSVETRTGVPLALGAAAGGLLGKALFSWVLSVSADPNQTGAVQAVCLTVVTVGTLLYTLYKDRIRTLRVRSVLWCGVLGMLLGVMSSFLGIGGGPINLVVLFYFFSMPTKAAAENSLYIIFFSQLASLISSIATGSVPEFGLGVLLWMAAGGIGGGILGRSLNRRIQERTVDRLFMGVMVLIILTNLYNVYQFLG